MIRPTADKTISDWLKQAPLAKKVLLRFSHGLGDALMFHAQALPALREKFPNVQFCFATDKGQEDIFGRFPLAESEYDLAFELRMPCSEWEQGNEAKGEKTCRVECGVQTRRENYALPRKFQSPLVAMHTHSTCLPNTLDCKEDFARRLWEQFCEEGLVPIDTTMGRPDSRAAEIGGYATRRVNDIKPTLPKLFGLLGACCGCASISSGNFFAALSVLPPCRVLYIATDFPAVKLTKLPVWEVDARKPYDEGKVRDFCAALKQPF